MKRIHLFEFEDQHWLPSWLRECITRMIIPMHKLLGTSDIITEILAPALKKSGQSKILDLCSGSGGPMLEILDKLETDYDLKHIELTFSDLYPNEQMVNADLGNNINYVSEPIDATKIPKNIDGFRTIICGFHHMKPNIAKEILSSAHKDKAPILIFEISDNSVPILLAFIALPVNFLMGFIVSLFVKPLTWQQIVFTYLIPIIPITFAWDGAISNIRTYTFSDMDELLEGLHSDDYVWKKEMVKRKTKHLYLLGMPR